MLLLQQVAAVEQITASFTPDTFNSTLYGVESHGPNENLHVSILKANSTRGLCFGLVIIQLFHSVVSIVGVWRM